MENNLNIQPSKDIILKWEMMTGFQREHIICSVYTKTTRLKKEILFRTKLQDILGNNKLQLGIIVPKEVKQKLIDSLST